MSRNYRKHAKVFNKMKISVTGSVAVTMDKQTRDFARK